MSKEIVEYIIKLFYSKSQYRTYVILYKKHNNYNEWILEVLVENNQINEQITILKQKYNIVSVSQDADTF